MPIIKVWSKEKAPWKQSSIRTAHSTGKFPEETVHSSPIRIVDYCVSSVIRRKPVVAIATLI